jgi:hypothetical protein
LAKGKLGLKVKLDVNERPSPYLEGFIGPGGAGLWNHNSRQPIVSGYEIVMKSDDPINKPLDILEM